MSDTTTAPDFVQPATMDFTSLYEKAMAHPADPTIDSAPAPADPPSVSDPSPVFDIPEDALVKVKIDGVEQTVPYRDYKDGVQREAAFTKRMQQLADQRREAESVITQRAAELQRQAEMLAYAQQQLQQQVAKPPAPESRPTSDPNEIATLGEVQQSLNAFQAQLAAQQAQREQLFFAQLQQAGQQLREEQLVQADAVRYTQALNATLNHDDMRLLRDVVPYAEESIRFQVAQLNPQTIDEAISFTEQVAKEWAGKIKAVSTESLTRQEVAKARAKMEPTAGSPPPLPGTRPKSAFGKNGQINWDLLRDRASSLMDG
jgi:hypothetical protein